VRGGKGKRCLGYRNTEKRGSFEQEKGRSRSALGEGQWFLTAGLGEEEEGKGEFRTGMRGQGGRLALGERGKRVRENILRERRLGGYFF